MTQRSASSKPEAGQTGQEQREPLDARQGQTENQVKEAGRKYSGDDAVELSFRVVNNFHKAPGNTLALGGEAQKVYDLACITLREALEGAREGRAKKK